MLYTKRQLKKKSISLSKKTNLYWQQLYKYNCRELFPIIKYCPVDLAVASIEGGVHTDIWYCLSFFLTSQCSYLMSLFVPEWYFFIFNCLFCIKVSMCIWVSVVGRKECWISWSCSKKCLWAVCQTEHQFLKGRAHSEPLMNLSSNPNCIRGKVCWDKNGRNTELKDGVKTAVCVRT